MCLWHLMHAWCLWRLEDGVGASLCLCLCVGAQGGKRCWISRELELQAAVRHLIGVLGTELRSSVRALCSLNRELSF